MKQIKFNIDENGKSSMEIDEEVTCKEMEEIAETFYSAIITVKMINAVRKSKEDKDA